VLTEGKVMWLSVLFAIRTVGEPLHCRYARASVFQGQGDVACRLFRALQKTRWWWFVRFCDCLLADMQVAIVTCAGLIASVFKTEGDVAWASNDTQKVI